MGLVDGNYSAGGTWVEGIAPTASDDVVFTALSANLTLDTTAACRSMDCTDWTGQLIRNATLNIGTSTVPASNIALKFVAGMSTSGSGLIQFISSNASGSQTVTWAGKTVAAVTFSQSNAAFTGGYILQDAMDCGTGALGMTRGVLTFTGQTITCGVVTSNSANVRTLTFTNCTVNCTGWNIAGSNFTLTLTGSTINETGGTFAGGGQTNYATVNLINNVTVTGANTFDTLAATAQGGKTVTFPASTTTTVTTALTLTGTSESSLLSIRSSIAGTAATLSSAGTVTAKFLSLKDSTAAGGASFAALDTINVSNNTGWTFPGGGGLLGTALNDLMLESLRSTYASTACLQDLLTQFETDNNLKGQASWSAFYTGSGAFNDRAYAYWNTH